MHSQISDFHPCTPRGRLSGSQRLFPVSELIFTTRCHSRRSQVRGGDYSLPSTRGSPLHAAPTCHHLPGWDRTPRGQLAEVCTALLSRNHNVFPTRARNQRTTRHSDNLFSVIPIPLLEHRRHSESYSPASGPLCLDFMFRD